MGLIPGVLAADRQQGKTTHLLAWLADGHKIDTYPGWSRIIVFTHRGALHEAAHDNWSWNKYLFSINDLRSAMRGAIRPGTVEYALDDAHLLIADALKVNQSPAMISLTGTPVDLCPQPGTTP